MLVTLPFILRVLINKCLVYNSVGGKLTVTWSKNPSAQAKYMLPRYFDSDFNYLSYASER